MRADLYPFQVRLVALAGWSRNDDIARTSTSEGPRGLGGISGKLPVQVRRVIFREWSPRKDYEYDETA